MDPAQEPAVRRRMVQPARKQSTSVFGVTREYLDFRYVYVFLSPRAGGLTVGINLNPDRQCNFDCVYCEVKRNRPAPEAHVNVEVLAEELTAVLDRVHQGHLRELPLFEDLPDELLELKHVALSGEGEPTLCPRFADVVQAIVHVRARGLFPFFKIALLTNGSVLDQPAVQAGLRHFILKDEIWIKLDAGSAAAFDAINRPAVSFAHVLANITALGRQRPIVLQSLFPLIDGQEPSEQTLADFVARLRDLCDQGVRIDLVQIYSATRPTARSGCRHLPLKVLSAIAHLVRDQTGLRVEVF
jgi:wyosine [tRNA(Phe)-imidazoG37] synthetase (radical SAM superfamily)